MTQLELNSGELNLILSALKQNRDRISKLISEYKTPQPDIIEDMPHKIEYLIEKLEPIFEVAKKEENKK